MKIGRRTTMLMLSSALIIPSVTTKDKRVSSADAFESTLAKAPYSVVLFYDTSRENKKDPEMRSMIKGLESMMRSLSRNPEYRETELQFLRVDISRRHLDELAQRYGVKTFPTVLLFLGRELTGSRLTGTVYRDQVQTLISQTFKTQMDQVLKEKAQQRRRELERARIRAYNYASWSPYWGWGYSPYWDWGYRGRSGFYFGW